MKLLHSLLILSFSVSVVLAVEGVTDKPSEPPKPEDPLKPEDPPSSPKRDEPLSPPKLDPTLDPPAPVDPKEFPPSDPPYFLNTSDNTVSCLKVQFAVQFTVEVTDSKVNETQYLSIRNATIRKPGCPENLNNTTELELELNFNKTSNVTFFFKRANPGEINESQWLDKIKIVFIDLFGIKQTKTLDTPVFISNGTHKSYECKAETKLDNAAGVKATFKAVHIDAFRDSVETKNSLTYCAADDDVNDMIPIAVGAALLALVAIVLVAYFIGRRRSRRLAYQSV